MVDDSERRVFFTLKIKIMELKAQDLRVGNAIINPFGAIGIVDEIHKCGFKIKSTLYALEHCKPIPITEDILLKCGFEKINKSRHIKGALTIYIEPNNIFRVYLCGNFIVNLEFLHDLQNLIFALTKTELTINL